jgi:hypothetical protein
MTIEDRIAKLEKELMDIRLENDVVHSESLKKRVIQNIIQSGVKDSTLTDINTTTNIIATPTSVSAASPYDLRLRIIVDGNPYYIGLYTP